METPKPQYVAGYTRYKKEKSTPKTDMLPVAVVGAIVVLMGVVVWQVGAVVAGIATVRITSLAVERYRAHVATQEPRLIVHRNA